MAHTLFFFKSELAMHAPSLQLFNHLFDSMAGKRWLVKLSPPAVVCVHDRDLYLIIFVE